jgi:hypothetical protein
MLEGKAGLGTTLRTATAAAAIAAIIASVNVTALAGDRLLATGGVTEIEGSAGGGLTPWALIAGLGTDRELGASAACTTVNPQDFRLRSCGLAAGVNDRLELSAAEQILDLGTTAPGQSIHELTFGAKGRLFGDAVIDQDRWWPQVALGLQWKHNQDFDLIPKALGARHASGLDVYLAATKLYLDGPLGRSWLVSGTLRDTEANQLGLLGFGGDRGAYRLRAEGSVGVFLNDQLAIGGEYRQKPDNLRVFREDNFSDAFLAWFPWKYASVTVAYAALGNIANQPNQHGLYLSLQGSW